MVDALASGASVRMDVEVRVLFWAPINQKKSLFCNALRDLAFSVSPQISTPSASVPTRAMPLKRAHHLGKRVGCHGPVDRVNMTGGAFAIVRGLQAQLFMQGTIQSGAGRIKTICNNSGKVE